MSILKTLFNTISTGSAHKLAHTGPFSQKGLRQNKLTDENSTKEDDFEAVRVLTEKRYDSKAVIRKNEVYEISSVINSKSFNMIDTLGKISDNLKKLNEKYNSSANKEEKEMYKNEITALTEQYNNTVNSENFKRLNEITKSLAARKYIDGSSSGMKKSLSENSGLLGANYMTQANLANSEYFRNLSQKLDGLSSVSLSADFTDGVLTLSDGGNSGISIKTNEEVLSGLSRRSDEAMSAFLRGSQLEGFLTKSIKEFRKLDKITEISEEGVLDLGSDIRSQILMNPEKGLAAQAFLSPFIALSTLI